MERLAVEYSISRCRQDLERLCEAALPLVRRLAMLIGRRLPPHLFTEDLVGDGCIGLLRAIDRYDPRHGATFETFASRIIRGAILNGIRRMDMVPERIRRCARELENARWKLAQGTGNEPTQSAVAAGAGLKLQRVQAIQVALRRGSAISLQAPASNAEPAVTVSERLVSENPNPADVAALRDLHDIVGRALRALPPRDQLILRAFYTGNRTFRDIGGWLGVSKQRVSQLHNRALLELRGALAAHFAEA